METTPHRQWNWRPVGQHPIVVLLTDEQAADRLELGHDLEPLFDVSILKENA